MLIYVFLGVAIIGLTIAWVLWMMRTHAELDPNSKPREGWLFAKDADKINVRSADNVRTLSEHQLDALEDALKNDAKPQQYDSSGASNKPISNRARKQIPKLETHIELPTVRNKMPRIFNKTLF